MIAIILATYNGEKYLRAQIDSLLENTCTDFHLYLFDDCSTDATGNIITEYVHQFPQKIFATIFAHPSGSACKNFFRGLQDVPDTYDYYMLCDQDDVWNRDKIALTLDAMQKAEGQTPDVPVLVHTDLAVVDAQLNIIAPSMAAFQRISHARISLPNLLVQNTVTGCTAMLNRALFLLVRTPPQRCAMHDWWMALVAAATGKIVYVPVATIRYRQHGDNSVGAKQAKGLAFYMSKWRSRNTVKSNYQDTFSQAQALLTQFGDRLSPAQRQLVTDYADIPQRTKLQRILVITRYKLYKNTLQRTVGQFLSI